MRVTGSQSGIATGSSEIWLRGNLRPVLWLAAGLALAAAGIVGGLVLMAAPPRMIVAAAVACGMLGIAVGVLAWAAARPRLVLSGTCLQVRLSPIAPQDVPLDVVECFFQGSNPISRTGEPTCGDHAAFRVNTLVMRLAERAIDHAARPTFTPWGTWQEGSVVFDGRWCEPLSGELARGLSRRLIDAKRAARPAGPQGPGATS